MPSLKTAVFGENRWFGYFEGESEGYDFRVAPSSSIVEQINNMLGKGDVSLKALSFGHNMWFAHGENFNVAFEASLCNRELVVAKNIDDFTDMVEERLKSQRALKVVHYADGMWLGYFEGLVAGQCSWSTCETNEELLDFLQQQLEAGMSLKAIAYGNDTWFTYFDGFLESDSTWIMKGSYKDFMEVTAEKQAKDHALRVVSYSNKVWFGYWEGMVSPDLGWAWGVRATIADFTKHIQELFEEDDEEEEDDAPREVQKDGPAGTLLRRRRSGAGAD